MTTPGPVAKRAVLLWAIVVTFVLVALLGIGAVFIGGSKTRNLFGASADALAGPDHVADAGAELRR